MAQESTDGATPLDPDEALGLIPSHIETREELNEWGRQISISPDEIGARFHPGLVAIHPFSNGNGRHGRLMTDALLEELGVGPFTWGSANLDGQGDARSAYLAALRRADSGDYSDLTKFVRT